MQRMAGKEQVAGIRALSVSLTPLLWDLANAQTPLGQGLLRTQAEPSSARKALAETPLSPPNNVGSPSQGQQEVGQEADSTREASWLPCPAQPSPPCWGTSPSLVWLPKVCKAETELHHHRFSRPQPPAGQTLGRGLAAQVALHLLSLS